MDGSFAFFGAALALEAALARGVIGAGVDKGDERNS